MRLRTLNHYGSHADKPDPEPVGALLTWPSCTPFLSCILDATGLIYYRPILSFPSNVLRIGYTDR